MRLTLRTLLAYLDDRLSSGNAREIGKKLNESPFAQELADRIRTVVRQRRLSAPGRKVKMIDPNLIAEYLDDQLTPELVSLIEKEILSSDFSLAEVAATHQILGLLGDHTEPSERLKARLTNLNPRRKAEESTDHEIDQSAAKRASDPDQEVWQPLAPQRSVSPRSPALILAVLLIGWIALFIRDGSSWQNDEEDSLAVVTDQQEGIQKQPMDAKDNGEPQQADLGSSGDVDPDDLIAEREPAAAESETATAPIQPSDAAETPESIAADMPDSGDAEDNDNSYTDSEAVAVVTSIEATMPAETSTAPGELQGDRIAAEPDPQSVPVPLPTTSQQFQYMVDAPLDMLLTRNPKGGSWMRATDTQKRIGDWHDLLTGQLLAVPEPFQTTVHPQQTGVSIALIAPVLAQFEDGIAPGIRLYDGRCIVTRQGDADPQQPGAVTLLNGATSLVCRLHDAGVRMGVAVFALPPQIPEQQNDVGRASDPLPLDNDVAVSVFVAGGRVTLQVPRMEPLELANGRSAHWSVRDGQAEDLQLSDVNQLNAIPQWVHRADEPPVAARARASKIISEELIDSDVLVESALGLANNRNSLVGEGATSILAVTRSVDGLINVMTVAREQQVRGAAIQGLRQTAAQSLAAQAMVLTSLENRLSNTSMEATVRLLQGLTPAEAEDPEASQWLVEMLDHDRPYVRQMAFTALVDVTGQTFNYNPDNERNRRRDSIKKVKKLLSRNDGRLVPSR